MEHGAGEVVESPLDTLETLCHWLDNEQHLLVERAENARRLGKPRAAFAVADAVWEVVQRTDTDRVDHRERSGIEQLLSSLGISWRD